MNTPAPSATPTRAATGATVAALVQGLPQPPGEYLAFRLGAEEYGIGILLVQEIRPYEQPTRIANAPDFLKGVIDLRGVIVPIVDLRLKLSCPRADFGPFTMVIVLNLPGRTVGVVVDAVSDVLELDPACIRPAPALGGGVDNRVVTGLGSLQAEGGANRTLVLLDIARLLDGTGLPAVRSDAVPA